LTSGNELKKTTIAAGSGAATSAPADTSTVFDKRLTNKYLEKETVLLNFRIPVKYKILYNVLTRYEKRMVKQVLLKTIESFARKEAVEEPEKQTIILNINIAAAKAEAKQHLDPEIIQEQLSIYRQELKEAKEAMKYWKKKYEQLSSIVRKMPENVGDKYVNPHKLQVLLQLVKKAKDLVK